MSDNKIDSISSKKAIIGFIDEEEWKKFQEVNGDYKEVEKEEILEESFGDDMIFPSGNLIGKKQYERAKEILGLMGFSEWKLLTPCGGDKPLVIRPKEKEWCMVIAPKVPEDEENLPKSFKKLRGD